VDRAQRRDEARENAVLKEEPLRHRIKAAWGPDRVRAAEKAGVPAGVKEKARVPDRAAVGGLNKSTNQSSIIIRHF